MIHKYIVPDLHDDIMTLMTGFPGKLTQNYLRI